MWAVPNVICQLRHSNLSSINETKPSYTRWRSVSHKPELKLAWSVTDGDSLVCDRVCARCATSSPVKSGSGIMYPSTSEWMQRIVCYLDCIQGGHFPGRSLQNCAFANCNIVQIHTRPVKTQRPARLLARSLDHHLSCQTKRAKPARTTTMIRS